MNSITTLVVSDFYITARKSTGGLKVRSVRFHNYWSANVKYLWLSFIFLIFILSSGPNSVNITIGLALFLLYIFMSVCLESKECKIFSTLQHKLRRNAIIFKNHSSYFIEYFIQSYKLVV